jgi:chondroitin-sulfate-ABC endolyase/exolyase
MAGGTSLGSDGIWGMVVKRGNVACRKSAFCFDGRISLLTSDIDTTSGPPVTTLFQLALDRRDEPVELDGKPIRAFPVAATQPLDRPIVLVDNRGNGYLVHPVPGASLHLERREQAWPFFDRMRQSAPEAVKRLRSKRRLTASEKRRIIEHCVPGTGDFTLATIRHTTRAGADRAAFTLFVRDKPPDGAPPYAILRQDKVAHVLRDKPSHTTGYAIFEAGSTLDAGVLAQSSRPCFVMLREADEARLLCSVSAPDEERREPIVLRLKGTWLPVGTDGPVCRTADALTTVTVPYRNYMPVRFALRNGGVPAPRP